MRVPQQLNPQTSPSARTQSYAQATDVPGGPLGRLGDSLHAVGKAFEERIKNEQLANETFDVNKRVLDESIALTQDLRQREEAAPPGAPNFVQDTMSAYEQRHQAILQEYSGYSKPIQQRLALQLENMRAGVLQPAFSFQAGAYAAKVGHDVSDMTDTGTQAVLANPYSIGSIETQINTTVDSLPHLTAQDREEYKTRSRAALEEAAAQGIGLYHPDVVAAHLAPEEDAVTLAHPDLPNTTFGNSEGWLNQYYQNLARQESGRAGNSATSDTGAVGKYQFQKSTWDGLIASHPNAGLTAAGRRDPQQQETAVRLFTNENIQHFNQNGIPITPGTLYLGAFFGATGATNLLKAGPGQKAADVIRGWSSGGSILASPTNRSAIGDKTVGELLSWANNLAGRNIAAEHTATPAAIAADPYSEFPIVHNPDRSQWDLRADGTTKGTGFIGLRQRPDGTVSSELSIGVEINGHETEIPTMVPGLTPQELHWLMTTPEDQQAQNMPRGIIQKAVAHARARIAQGLSPFKQDGEPDYNPTPQAPISPQAQVIAGEVRSGVTGDPVLDRLNASQRLTALRVAQTEINRTKAQERAGLEVHLQNETAARLATGDYAGTSVTQAELVHTYGEAEGNQKFAALQAAQHTGQFVVGMKTASNTSIAQSLERLRPKDTASPTYAADLAAYNAAGQAAASVLHSRETDPAQYVLQNFPNIQQAFSHARDPASSQLAFRMMREAQSQLGINGASQQLMTDDMMRQDIASFQPMSPEQKVAFLRERNAQLGEGFDGYLDKLSTHGLGAEAWAAGLTGVRPEYAPTARMIMEGTAIMRADPARTPEEKSTIPAFQTVFGSAINNLDPRVSAAIRQSAVAIYVARGGNASPNATINLEPSIREALGGSADNPDTGIVDLRPSGTFFGHSGNVSDKTILPPGVTGTQFQHWTESLSMQSVINLARGDTPKYANGNPASIDDIHDEGVYVQRSPNRYNIKMSSDGGYLYGRDGRPIIITITPRNVLGH